MPYKIQDISLLRLICFGSFLTSYTTVSIPSFDYTASLLDCPSILIDG